MLSCAVLCCYVILLCRYVIMLFCYVMLCYVAIHRAANTIIGIGSNYAFILTAENVTLEMGFMTIHYNTQ